MPSLLKVYKDQFFFQKQHHAHCRICHLKQIEDYWKCVFSQFLFKFDSDSIWVCIFFSTHLYLTLVPNSVCLYGHRLVASFISRLLLWAQILLPFVAVSSWYCRRFSDKITGQSCCRHSTTAATAGKTCSISQVFLLLDQGSKQG